MKAIKLAMVAAAALSSVSISSANPPTQVGDSFLLISIVAPGGLRGTGLYYMANDGSFKEFEYTSQFGGHQTSAASQSGTYTYVPTSGNPLEATLTFTGTNTSDVLVLDFDQDRSGHISNTPELAFSLLFASPNTFLTNVSNRVTLRPTDTSITGFVIEGDATRLVLIRAVGPALAQFGVSPVSANPNLALFGTFSGLPTIQLGSGQPWSSSMGLDAQAMSWIFSMVGAFPLMKGSSDVVYFGPLSSGTYTAQSSDTTTGVAGGSALTEVYILPYSM